jgi:hypothetical protein
MDVVVSVPEEAPQIAKAPKRRGAKSWNKKKK